MKNKGQVEIALLIIIPFIVGIAVSYLFFPRVETKLITGGSECKSIYSPDIDDVSVYVEPTTNPHELNFLGATTCGGQITGMSRCFIGAVNIDYYESTNTYQPRVWCYCWE